MSRMLYLVAAALTGAVADIALIWRIEPLVALATAPFAGSLAAGCAGFALHRLTPRDEVRDDLELAHAMDTDAMVSVLRGAAELGRRDLARREPGPRVVPRVLDQRRHAM